MSMPLMYWGVQQQTQQSRWVSLVLSRGEGSPSPPASNILPNAAQDAITKHIAGTCPSWCPPGPTKAFSANLFSRWSALVAGFIPPQGHNLGFPFMELHDVPVGPFFQPPVVPLNSSTPTWSINHSSQFCIINKLSVGALCSIIQITNEDITQYWPQDQSQGYTTNNWLPDGLHVAGIHPLNPTLQQFSACLTAHPFIYFIRLDIRTLQEIVSKALLKRRKQHSLLLPLTLYQSFHHRRVSGWSHMISPFVNVSSQLQITLTGSEMVSRMICPGIKVKMTQILLLVILETEMALTFFHSSVRNSPQLPLLLFMSNIVHKIKAEYCIFYYWKNKYVN